MAVRLLARSKAGPLDEEPGRLNHATRFNWTAGKSTGTFSATLT